MNEGTISNLKFEKGKKPQVQIHLDLHFQEQGKSDNTIYNIYIFSDLKEAALIKADEWFEVDFPAELVSLMNKKCVFELDSPNVKTSPYCLNSIIVKIENE